MPHLQFHTKPTYGIIKKNSTVIAILNRMKIYCNSICPVLWFSYICKTWSTNKAEYHESKP